MIFKPWLEAVWMEHVSAWQEIGFVTQLKITHTYRASWHFLLPRLVLFTMFFLNWNLWHTREESFISWPPCCFFLSSCWLFHCSSNQSSKIFVGHLLSLTSTTASSTLHELLKESNSRVLIRWLLLTILLLLTKHILIASSGHTTSKVLTEVHAKFMRVKIVMLLCHILKLVIIEHACEIKWPEELIKYCLLPISSPLIVTTHTTWNIDSTLARHVTWLIDGNTSSIWVIDLNILASHSTASTTHSTLPVVE